MAPTADLTPASAPHQCQVCLQLAGGAGGSGVGAGHLRWAGHLGAASLDDQLDDLRREGWGSSSSRVGTASAVTFRRALGAAACPVPVATHHVGGLPGPGQLPGQQLPHDQTKGIHIGGLAGRPTLQHLGGLRSGIGGGMDRNH